MAIKVAVLRGGPSPEYEASLKTGAHVLSLLRNMADAYEPVDIFISKGNEWHQNGMVHEPHQALKHADVVWNALHGHYGEDGQVQRLLESLNIPFTGTGALGSALSMDKALSKQIYLRHSLLTPRHEVIKDDVAHEQLVYIFHNYLHPVIVKPSKGGVSLGMRIARTFRELEEAVKHALSYSKKVIVEEFIKGKTATCGVIERAKGEKLYTLMPTGRTSIEENKIISEMSKTAHDVLGLRHYSSSDFIITPKGKIYIIGSDSLPNLHEDSLMHQSLISTGWKPHDFADHCLKLALEK